LKYGLVVPAPPIPCQISRRYRAIFLRGGLFVHQNTDSLNTCW